MSKVREILGTLLLIIAILSYVIGGIYTLIICLAIVRVVFGQVVAYLSLLIFPVLIALAPWYAFLAWGNYQPLLVVYGIWITASIFFGLSKWLKGNWE